MASMESMAFPELVSHATSSLVEGESATCAMKVSERLAAGPWVCVCVCALRLFLY